MRKKVIVRLCEMLLMAVMCCMIWGDTVYAQTSADGFEYEINESSTIIITGYNGVEQNITIPSEIAGYKVGEIGDGAFSESTVKSVIISDGITRVGYRAFADCINLETIKLPESISYFSEEVFSNCSNLVNVSLPKDLKRISLTMFYGCSSLKNIDIPDTVTEIDNNAFYGCSSLESIDLPESLTSIGLDAFRECISLKTVTIPKNVQELEENIFKKCDELEEIKIAAGNKIYGTQDGVLFDKTTKTLVSYPAGKANFVYTVPEGIVIIGDHAFHENVGNLKTVELPESVKTLGTDTFYGERISIENLKFFSKDCVIAEEGAWYEEFTVNKEITLYGYAESTAQEYAEKFNRNFVELTEDDKLTYPTIFAPEEESSVEEPSDDKPSSQQSINNGEKGNATGNKITPNKNMSSNLSVGTVLNDRKSKATYTITVSGTAVEYKAPANKKVKKVTIPSSVTINGITYKVTSIAPNAFKKCKKLKKVTIGAGVTEIGKNAFSGCKNLKNVIVKSKSLKKVGKNAFKGINKTAKIKVPKKKIKAYTKLLKKAKVAKSVKITK